MITSEVNVGTITTVKVGRNEVEVTVIEVTENGWIVKSNSSGREFEVSRFERIVGEAPVKPVSSETAPVEPESADLEPENESEEGIPVSEEDNSNPAPESGRQEKKLSLLDAAAEVLKNNTEPLNSKEIIAKAIADGLWIPSGAKTPEQSLYSAIFREMQSKEAPRFKRSDKKGCFEAI